ncbi:unnamed protein product [Spirodela intermedia]|uniref:Uncharacterized protein n=1 Tax=Spirodela intermedia TaxID=51605 RepID=A0A7I8IH59_SPIIN|nr:unnamed protein product [Spirodela intermedia]CAA6656837.1 unnamed protein product [Spirodela intermedia]
MGRGFISCREIVRERRSRFLVPPPSASSSSTKLSSPHRS